LSADRWFVALDETREILAGKGVPRERVEVTGIPIAATFSAALPPREQLRSKHDLGTAGPLLLVSGGGVGISLLDRTLEALLDTPMECSIALVCERNAPLRSRAERVVASRPASPIRCRVLGFTDQMHELMRAADLSIRKPGDLTSSEALASGLPIAIVHPVPGQEERNSDHLLEWGCAIRLNSPESIGWRVTSLLADAERLAFMRECARARPFAAESIVAALSELHRPAPSVCRPVEDSISQPALRVDATFPRTRAMPEGRVTTPQARH